MKAILHCEYGGPEVLTLADVEKPTPADNQILVKVRAASLNPLDLTIRGALARYAQCSGMRKPKETRLGVDYAGTVEAVGKNVTQFKPGDDVFGGRNGAIARVRLCSRAIGAVVLKPANITFEQAAAVPVAAITALQGLRDKGKIQAGQKVLINGASGGVGTFAVQIAKSFGDRSNRRMQHAQCRSCPLNRRRSRHRLHQRRFHQRCAALRPDLRPDWQPFVFERRRILNPNGICVMAGVGGAGWHDDMGCVWLGEFNAYVRSRFVQRKIRRLHCRI